MHAQDETPERIAIRFHVQDAGCQLNPVDGGQLWNGEPVGIDYVVDGSSSSYITTPIPLIHS